MDSLVAHSTEKVSFTSQDLLPTTENLPSQEDYF